MRTRSLPQSLLRALLRALLHALLPELRTRLRALPRTLLPGLRGRGVLSATLAIALGSALGPASVLAQSERDPIDSPYGLSLFHGQGADVNLPNIPHQAVHRQLIWEHAHFIGLHGQFLLYRTPDFPLLPFYRVKGLRLELEGQYTQHWGLQENGEVHTALVFRTQDFNPFLDFGFNLAYADGISHALSTPEYEDGPGGGKTGPRYATQHFIGIELAAGWLTWPQWQLVARIHHRSGIWGIFAPQGVGSNFFAFGVRWRD